MGVEFGDLPGELKEHVSRAVPEEPPVMPEEPVRRSPGRPRKTKDEECLVRLPQAVYDGARSEAEARGQSLEEFVAQAVRKAVIPKRGDGICPACGCRDEHSETCVYAKS